MVELSVLLSLRNRAERKDEEQVSKLKQIFKQPFGKVFKNVEIEFFPLNLHDVFGFVQAHMAPLVQYYYIETLIKEMVLKRHSTPTKNLTCSPCWDIINALETFSKSDPKSCINLQ